MTPLFIWSCHTAWEEYSIEWHFIAPGKPIPEDFVELDGRWARILSEYAVFLHQHVERSRSKSIPIRLHRWHLCGMTMPRSPQFLSIRGMGGPVRGEAGKRRRKARPSHSDLSWVLATDSLFTLLSQCNLILACA